MIPLETVTNTVKHKKTCSFCQKAEYLHVVNNPGIAQLPGIKLISRIFDPKLVVSGIICLYFPIIVHLKLSYIKT